MSVAIIAHTWPIPVAYQTSHSTTPSLVPTFATHYTTSTSTSNILSSSPPSSVVETSSIRDTPMFRHRKCSTGVISTLLSYLTLSASYSLPSQGESATLHSQDLEQIASPSWLESKTCRWLGICGSSHLNGLDQGSTSEDIQKQSDVQQHRYQFDPASFWTSGNERPENWSSEEHMSREIPQYVYDYTPYVHLFSGEQFWPCDMAEHLVHTSPYLNYTQISRMKNDRTLENLDELNNYGQFTYLQSEDNVEERPEWLGGSANIPRTPDKKDSDQSSLIDKGRKMVDKVAREFGQKPIVQPAVHSEMAHQKHEMSSPGHARGGHSSAPAILIVVPKENGIVDAFWFYFYSYNLGNQVLNVRFGNHVGDWEHSMVRFQNGTPQAVYISEHGAGEAYSYEAVEKIGKRPVIYSATGTHAVYATAGLHPYVLPWGLLHDQTDRGPLWDPNLNNHAFVYNYTTRTLKSSAQTPQAPVNWFYYGGHWGDKQYPSNDRRQYKFLGQYHYVSGPSGPRFKNLGRKKVCQRRGQQCIIRHWLGDDNQKRTWPGKGPGDEIEEIEEED